MNLDSSFDHFQSLLYPLGLGASLLFTARFFVQWFLSEKKRQSHVTASFWKLSLVGNAIMLVHAFIQLQFPIALLQASNGTIAWRNLNLMGKKRWSRKKTIFLLLGLLIGVASLFILEEILLDRFVWMQSPKLPWSTGEKGDISLFWHLFGGLGLLLFASRFWLQWWSAEKSEKSSLNASFWWTSFFGGLISLAYFIQLEDMVNILGYGVGMIPYLRNLMLLRKKKIALDETKIFLFAGEQSGDQLGGELISSLRKIVPDKTFFGVGGKKMREEGLLTTIPMEKFQVMGFSAVLKVIFRLTFYFYKIKKEILLKSPALVILIDYPDFTMWLGRALKKGGYKGKIVHYVSPTVWAWRKNRAKKLSKHVDLLLTIFPFEKQFYEKVPLNVAFVGHPLVKTIERHLYTEKLSKTRLLSLFPGSRHAEIQLNLPLQLEVAKKMLENDPTITLAISVARKELEKDIEMFVEKANLKALFVPSTKRYELMKESEFALATSGTVTLELALHHVPTIVTYKLSTLNYLLGRYVFRIRLPHYCIVNIMCKEEVFPEFIQKELSSDAIFQSLNTLMKDNVKQKCKALRDQFLDLEASEKAAKEISRLLT